MLLFNVCRQESIRMFDDGLLLMVLLKDNVNVTGSNRHQVWIEELRNAGWLVGGLADNGCLELLIG